jgi:hypothetical protein
MSTNVLGYNISMPIMISPTALHKMAHPEGIRFISIHFVLFWHLRNKIPFLAKKKERKFPLWTFILNAGELASARAAATAGTIMV